VGSLRKANDEQDNAEDGVAMAILSRYPNLSPDEVQLITNRFFDETSKRIQDGETPAFVKFYSDGSFDLTLLELDLLSGDE
jgi:hypothetical protein